jgi:hypothetical protein
MLCQGDNCLIFLLLYLELHAIYHDFNDHQRELEITLGKFDQTLSSIQKIFFEETGGDSYLYFTVSNNLNIIPNVMVDGKDSVMANVFPNFSGKFPLHSVIVSPFCPTGWLPTINYETIYPNQIGRPYTVPNLHFPSTIAAKDANCSLFIVTSNGSYNQLFHFINKDGRWTWGSLLIKYRDKEFRHTYFGDGFPRDYNWATGQSG